MPAYCAAVGADIITYWCTFITASASGAGAATQPSRQPVIAYALLHPPSSTVRSRIPGSAAKQTCWLP